MNRILIALLGASLIASAQDADVAAGAAALQRKDYAAAEVAYGKAIQANPKHAGAYLGRAYARLFQGKAKEAIADLDQLIAIDDKVGPVYRLRADARRRLRDEAGALEDFAKALERTPDDPNLYLNRGLAHEAVGDYEAALKDYTRVCEIRPDVARGFLNRAEVLQRLGRHKDALGDFEGAIFNGATTPALYVTRARTYMALGKPDKAAEDIKQATDLGPDDADMFIMRGRYHFDHGENAKAVADLAQGIAKGETGNTEYARFYLCIARMRAGDAAKGKKELADYLDARKVKDDWFCKIAGFLAGRVPEADLLAAMKHENPVLDREQKCEAYWYAGAVRLLAGDVEKAKEYFAASKAANVRNFIEYESSVCALK